LAKINLKKHRVSLFRKKEKKRRGNDVHNHRLLEIAAWEASSKRVKETAASHKTQSKEKALEVSNQHVQTMMDTYNGTHLGQFPNGHTNFENVSSENPSSWFFFSPLVFFHSFCRLSQT
jgi:phage repressor protein C with HTH and peptisase S24 domain